MAKEPSVAMQQLTLRRRVDAYLREHAGGALRPGAIQAVGVRVRLSREFVVERLFGPVLAATAQHVAALLAGPGPSRDAGIVVAAGGFAESPLLVARLEAAAAAARAAAPAGSPAAGLRLLVAPQPGLAIVRGATLFGMFPDALIASRVVRASYALGPYLLSLPWREGCQSRGRDKAGKPIAVGVRALAIAGEEMGLDERRSQAWRPADERAVDLTLAVYRSEFPFAAPSQEACLLTAEAAASAAKAAGLNAAADPTAVAMLARSANGVLESDRVANMTIPIGSALESGSRKSGVTHVFFGRSEVAAESISDRTGATARARITFA